MSTSTLFISLFKYKAWANREIFSELEKVDAVLNQEELHEALHILNHINVVDRIFAAHLSGKTHIYTATNTPDIPALEVLRAATSESDRWYVEYVSALDSENFRQNLIFTFTDGTNGRMSREEILAHVITHGDYHRGVVGRIMSQLSLFPPESFAGYLHKTESPRRG